MAGTSGNGRAGRYTTLLPVSCRQLSCITQHCAMPMPHATPHSFRSCHHVTLTLLIKIAMCTCSGDKGTPLLLIHGFGASAYHWRYNINELAKTHRVYAIDLLGFGWSDKPLVEYSKYDLWPRQVSTFINEVISQFHNSS